MMLPLLSLKGRILRNSLRHPDRPAKTIFFLLLSALFMTGLYFWVRRIFLHLVSVPIIGEVVLVRFLALLIFIAGGMAVLSTMLSAVSTIYTTEELKLLTVYPVSSDSLFAVKMLEASVYADWMIIVVGFPFALAWRSIYSINFTQAFFCAVCFLLFLLAMSFTGVIFATLFCLALPGRKIRDSAIVAFSVIFAGVFFYLKALEPEFIFQADAYENLFQYLTLLKMPGTLLAPFQWMSRLFIGISSGAYGEALAIAGVLLIVFFASGLVCFALGSKYLFRICGTIRARGGSKGSYTSAVPEGRVAALGWKERITFIRNSEQISQAVILFLLSAIYLFSVYKAPLGDLPPVKKLLTFLNMGGVGLILAASALRFVFTGICLEGRHLWILFSSPFVKGKIIRKKISFYSAPMTLTGFILGILSGMCFRAQFAFTLFTGGICAVMAYTITRLAVFFAVSYPEYQTDNPARMESSYGGLLFMVASMFYTASVLAILAYPAYWYLTGTLFSGGVALKFTAGFAILFVIDNFIFAGISQFWTERVFLSRDHRNLIAQRL